MTTRCASSAIRARRSSSSSNSVTSTARSSSVVSTKCSPARRGSWPSDASVTTTQPLAIASIIRAHSKYPSASDSSERWRLTSTLERANSSYLSAPKTIPGSSPVSGRLNVNIRNSLCRFQSTGASRASAAARRSVDPPRNTTSMSRAGAPPPTGAARVVQRSMPGTPPSRSRRARKPWRSIASTPTALMSTTSGLPTQNPSESRNHGVPGCSVQIGMLQRAAARMVASSSSRSRKNSCGATTRLTAPSERGSRSSTSSAERPASSAASTIHPAMSRMNPLPSRATKTRTGR